MSADAFDEFWAATVQTNSSMANDKTVMRISVVSFKTQMRRAFHAGQKNQKAFNDLMGKLAGAGHRSWPFS